MLIVGWLFGISQTFWYFEKTAYCKFDNWNVTVYMKKEWWLSKCKVYLDTIYQLSLQKYDEISRIRAYVAQWDDIWYWKWILEEKQSEFLKLVNYRVQIQDVISKFETAFFEQYSTVLKKQMELYYSDLEVEYYILINQATTTGTSHLLKDTTRISNLEQQMWTVDHILNAKKLDDIMDVVSSYLYLKWQLEWK